MSAPQHVLFWPGRDEPDSRAARKRWREHLPAPWKVLDIPRPYGRQRHANLPAESAHTPIIAFGSAQGLPPGAGPILLRPSQWNPKAGKPLQSLTNQQGREAWRDRRRAQRILLGSPSQAEWWRETWPETSERLRLVRPAVDALPPAPERALALAHFGFMPEVDLILFAGRDWPNESIREAILFAAMLRDHSRTVEILAIGDGDAVRFGAYAEALGIGPRIQFRKGWETWPTALAASRYWIAPGKSDPTGWMLTQALGIGLLPVTLQNHGACDLIEHLQNGWLLRDDSPEELKEAANWCAERLTESSTDITARKLPSIEEEIKALTTVLEEVRR